MDRSSPSVVDLTSNFTSFPNQITPPRYQIAIPDSSPNSERRATKRRRLSRSQTSIGLVSTSSGISRGTDAEPIESVDLTEVEGTSALEKALSKQREDAVKAQQGKESEKDGRSALTSYKCPVCMDTPVDATSTICGHLFCHKCIIDTLRFSEGQRSDSVGKGRGTCPVCRKSLSCNDSPGPKRNLVPLQLKLMTRKEGAVAPETA